MNLISSVKGMGLKGIEWSREHLIKLDLQRG